MNLINKFKELEPKQKVTLAITTVLFVVFVYLIYDTFFASSEYSSPSSSVAQSKEETVTEVKPITTQLERADIKDPIQLADSSQTKNQSVNPLSPKQNPDSSVELMADGQPTSEQLEIIEQSRQLQREYLKLLNEYQMAQLQQKLQTANSAIAAAKLKTASTVAKTKELEEQVKSTEITQAEKDQAIYSQIAVVYVGEKNGLWSAMLQIDKQYYEVKVGTELPGNSSVDTINEDGVVIETGTQKRFFRVPKSLD